MSLPLLRRPLLVVGLCALVLAACEPRFEVRLASSEERSQAPAFTVVDPEKPQERPRFHSVQVLAEDGRVVWHLRAEPNARDTGDFRVVYGAPLGGFSTVVPPEPLTEGSTYRIEVSGGPRGSLRFTVEPGGRLRAL